MGVRNVDEDENRPHGDDGCQATDYMGYIFGIVIALCVTYYYVTKESQHQTIEVQRIEIRKLEAELNKRK